MSLYLAILIGVMSGLPGLIVGFLGGFIVAYDIGDGDRREGFHHLIVRSTYAVMLICVAALFIPILLERSYIDIVNLFAAEIGWAPLVVVGIAVINLSAILAGYWVSRAFFFHGPPPPEDTERQEQQ